MSETTEDKKVPELQVIVHDTLIEATLQQFMNQTDSQFFGFYKCSFSEAAYKAAIGDKGLSNCGYMMEKDAEKGFIIALIKPDYVVVEGVRGEIPVRPEGETEPETPKEPEV